MQDHKSCVYIYNKLYFDLHFSNYLNIYEVQIVWFYVDWLMWHVLMLNCGQVALRKVIFYSLIIGIKAALETSCCNCQRMFPRIDWVEPQTCCANIHNLLFLLKYLQYQFKWLLADHSGDIAKFSTHSRYHWLCTITDVLLFKYSQLSITDYVLAVTNYQLRLIDFVHV